MVISKAALTINPPYHQSSSPLQFRARSLPLTPSHTRYFLPTQQEIGVREVTTWTPTGGAPCAAVDDGDLAGDVVAGVAEEEDCGVGDLFDAAPSSQWDPLQLGCEFVCVGLLGETVHSFCAADGAGGDDVGCYAPRAVFDGDLGGEGVDAGFGDGGVRLQGCADVVQRGGDVDDASRGAGG